MIEFRLGSLKCSIDGECEFDARHQKLRILRCADDGTFGVEMAFMETPDYNQDRVTFDWKEQKITARVLGRKVTHDYHGGPVCYEAELDSIEGTFTSSSTRWLLFFIRDVDIQFHDERTWDISTGCDWDYTPFTYQDRKWVLRNAWVNKADPLMPYLYNQFVDHRDKKQTCGAFLETYLKPEEDEDQICKMASSICNLASFAYGTHFLWDSLWKRRDDGALILAKSRRYTNDSRQSECDIIPSCNPAKFVEAVDKEFNQNRKWWSETLLWFLYAKTSLVLEVKKMIEGMLFDRVSLRFFNSILEVVGLPELQTMQFGKKKERLRKQLKEIIELFSSENANEEEIAFIDFLSKWTDMPDFTSFIGRVEALFDQADRPLMDIEKELIKYRNGLVHMGEINDNLIKNPYDIVLYDARISKLCLLLILSMLGYPNRFQTRYEESSVSRELPRWDRLRLSSVAITAAKLKEQIPDSKS